MASLATMERGAHCAEFNRMFAGAGECSIRSSKQEEYWNLKEFNERFHSKFEFKPF